MAGYQQPPLGPYEYYEVVSAFRKEIKLGREEQAIYWLTVWLKFGDGKSVGKSIARQLWILAAEDIDDDAVVLRAHAVHAMSTVVSETDHLYFLVAKMCKARKWWETEEGRETDRFWALAEGKLQDGVVVPVPEYALDRHTRKGWASLKARGFWDDRFSGTEIGRAKTRYLFLRDGKLDPDAELDDGFLAYWQQRVQEMRFPPGHEEVKYGPGWVGGQVYGPRSQMYDESDQEPLFGE